MQLKFEVRHQSREARWIVCLNDVFYGSYLDRQQAILDAVDAARDAQQFGRNAQAWLREQASAAQIY